MALIEARNIHKIFGQEQQQIAALDGVSLSILEGEMVAVMGPSGSGKTTLLNALSGIDSITSGEVIISGERIFAMPDKHRDLLRAQWMGFVFQSYNLIPVLTAVENVELPLLCLGFSARKARRIADSALARVGLKERSAHLPSELSGGQQQRVALARAIVNKPKVVWADEPTGALDRATTDMVIDLMKYLNRVDGTTFVIVTHNPNVAAKTHRVLYMDSGRIIQERQVQEMAVELT